MEKKYFISALAPKIKTFIEFKNSLGVEYKTGSRYLLQLDEYNYNNGNSSTLDREIVEAWIIKHELKCQSQSRSWVSYIREFGKYLQRTGDTNAYILSDNFKINKYRAETYLMNENEVKSFFKNEIMIVVLIALCVVFGIINPNFVSGKNLLNIEDKSSSFTNMALVI